MLYIDLLLSLILFIAGIVLLSTGRHRKNIYVIFLSLIFFPLSIFSYYLKGYNVKIFDDITVLKFITYIFIKVMIILVLVKYIKTLPKRKGL